MTDALVGLVQGDALQQVFGLKSKSLDEKTVAATTREALDLKVAGELADGWHVLRENKMSTRLGLDKPADRQLEDDVWCLLYRMGFKELNEGRQILVQTSPTAPARQLDVFARDDETAIVVECTHSRDMGSKSVKALIDKICAIREEVINAVHKQFGKNPKLKVKFASELYPSSCSRRVARLVRELDTRVSDRALEIARAIRSRPSELGTLRASPRKGRGGPDWSR